MKYSYTVTIYLIIAVFSLSLAGDYLDEHLLPLKPFIGKTWKGKFQSESGEKVSYDVSRWERALNGKAVRILHSLNDGEYGGESLIFWDSQQEKLIFFYVTTAGFYSEGSFTFENNQFNSHEFIKGNQGGIAEVKGTGELLPDGTMLSKSQYLKNGKWVKGHEVLYKEDPDARVIFK